MTGGVYARRAVRALRDIELAQLDCRINAALAGCDTICVRAAATPPTIEGRTLTVIAVPYEQPTQVIYRGAPWTEVFSRSAFIGITVRAPRIPVLREHDRTKLVGKVTALDPAHPRGLLASLRIAGTSLGDETLALAADDMLSASVGFTVPHGGAVNDHAARTRRINRAQLDHIGLVADPAYPDAIVCLGA